MGRTAIRCSCGQRIGMREVLHAGYYPRPFGPSYMLVRYRCSRCRKTGERFLKQEEWRNGILQDSRSETSPSEQAQFTSLGPIRVSEQAEFHAALDALDDLNELIAEFKPEKS